MYRSLLVVEHAGSTSLLLLTWAGAVTTVQSRESQHSHTTTTTVAARARASLILGGGSGGGGHGGHGADKKRSRHDKKRVSTILHNFGRTGAFEAEEHPATPLTGGNGEGGRRSSASGGSADAGDIEPVRGVVLDPDAYGVSANWLEARSLVRCPVVAAALPSRR